MKRPLPGAPALGSDSYQILIESSADAVVGADSSGRIILWNDAATAMFGYRTDQILGESVSVLVAEHSLRDYERGFASAIDSGRAELSHLLLTAVHADGTEFGVEVAVSVTGRGTKARAFGIIRKIEQRYEKLALLQENERRLRDAEQLANVGSFEWKVASDTLTWSDELYCIFGVRPGEAPQKFRDFLGLIHPDDRSAVEANIRECVTNGVKISMHERIVRIDTGEIRILSSNVKPIFNARGDIVRLSGTCCDVTDQRNAESALGTSEARFRHVFDDAPIGMLLVRIDGEIGTITRSNKALSSLLGYTKAELSALSPRDLVASEDWPLLQATLAGIAAGDSTAAQLEIHLRGAEGRCPIVMAAAASIGDSSSDLILHFEDVTERKRAEDQLRHRALHDSLTGLPNRDLLLDRLEGALARALRTNASVAVLFLDMDNFKLINDTIGHVAGDEMLRIVANRLVAVARSGDTAARVGGDEFVVVCEDVTHDEEVLPLAQRVADALTAPMSIRGFDFTATVSIGIAIGRASGDTPEQLLRDADLAMYRAKQQGKNTIEVFDEALRRHAIHRVEVERELRTALQNNEIFPYYQPIIALDTGLIIGFEALARWHHPKLGVLLPKAFLSVAEDAHLIGSLGEVMLNSACAQLAEWLKIAPELRMSVNLSLRQLDGNFARSLLEMIANYRLPASTLQFEVTESVLLDMHKTAGADLNAVANIGIRLGIDDFGTGYSSLVYLKRFPVQFLKIDRSFVDGLPGNQEDASIVEAIVRLGQSLGLSTSAEGVETAEQLNFLVQHGCSSAQGHFISPPLPADACTRLLQENEPLSTVVG